MERLYFFVILIFFSGVSMAQIDRSTGGGIGIPAVESPMPTPEKNNLFSRDGLLMPDEKPLGFPKEEEKKPMNMTTDNGLMTYTLDNFTPKAFTKDKEAKDEFGSDQYLGDYLTKGDFVELYCRDHEFVDGDKVNIYLNGMLVQRSVSLVGGYKPILITLKPGFNTIEFEALNQGTSGPNTAELVLFDDKGQSLAHKEWNLLTGAKARIVVVKN